MRCLSALLLALLLAGPAVAQVQQSGNVTPGHPAMWATTGVIQDGGSVSTPALTNVGVLNSGLGICDQNLPTSGSYVQLCLGFAGGVPTIFANGPGMGSLLNFNINGVTTSFGPAGPYLPLTGGTVSGDATFSGAGTGLAVTNNATVGGTLGVTGNTSLSNATVGGTLGVGTNETVGGTLGVTGASSLHNTGVTGTLGVTGATTLTGATQINNTLGVTGNTTLGNATVGGTLGVTGTSTLGNGGVSIYNQPYYGGIGEVDANSFGLGPLTGKRALGAGGNLAPYLYLSDALSGTKTGGVSTLAYISTTSDTMNAGGSGIQGLRVDLQGGGAGAIGNRIGIYSNLSFAGTNGVKTANSGLYSPLWAYGYASGNVGGTSGTGNQYGIFWGGVISATLQSGATYWQETVGLEIDVGVSTGASASYVQGAKIVLQNHNQATSATDYMLGFTSNGIANTGLGNGISFGSPDGYWPFATTASLITTIQPNASLPGGTGPAYAAAYGVDLSGATFSTAAFKSTGFLVDGAGATSVTKLTITQHTPATSSEACTAGQITADATYIYTCVATNTWHRVSNGATW